MAYTPTVFTKGDTNYTVVTSWREHFQLLWDGWHMGGPAPAPDPAITPAHLSDLATLARRGSQGRTDLGLGTAATKSPAEIAADPALNAAFAPRWKANTAYTAGTVVQAPDGTLVQAVADFTSGASYNAVNWAPISVSTGQGAPRLTNWYRAFGDDPSSVKIALSGDSTSTEANDGGLHTTIRNIATTVGSPLEGMTADASHIIDGGNNGMALSVYLSNYDAGDTSTKSLRWLIAQAPNLVILSWGINDVRLGQTTKAQLVARLRRVVNILRAALPTCDIVLRIPNTLATNNLGGLNYVTATDGTINPAGQAQTYSDLMRSAYRSLRDSWPNVTLLDIPKLVFGTKSVATTDFTLLADQLHPSTNNGYRAIADAIVEHIAPPRDKAPAVLLTARTRLADSLYSTTLTPWALSKESLYDSPHFEMVAAGLFVTGGTNFIRAYFGRQTSADFQIGDILELPDGSVYVTTSGASDVVGGNVVPNVQLNATGIPAGANLLTNDGPVRVWRERDQGDLLFASLRQSHAYRTSYLGRIQAGGGTGFGDIEAMPAFTSGGDTLPSKRWAFSHATAKLWIARYPSFAAPASVALSAYTSAPQGNNLRIFGTGVDFSALANRLVLITDTRERDGVTERVENVSVAAGTVAAQATADVAVTVTGARFSRPFTAVVAQPRATLAAGVTATAFVSATDQVTVRFNNPTLAGVAVGTVAFDFHILR